MIELPNDLLRAIEDALAGTSTRALARRAEQLSERYRSRGTGTAGRIRNSLDAQAYLAQWMPATFAQSYGALATLPPRLGPDWSPRTVLDLGSGPGTALWATAELWPEADWATAVDRSRPLVEVGRELARAAPQSLLRGCCWIEGDLCETIFPSADLVILAHSLAELPGAGRSDLIERAWSACEGVLTVIEPGTPGGFQVVERARTRLLELGAQLLAPCPHATLCPLAGADSWCHFPQRVERPWFQRETKGAELGWEDAKFSFVSVGRRPALTLPFARLVGVPRHARGRVRLDLCSARGLESPAITRGDKAALRRAKKLRWGAAVESAAELGLRVR